MIARAIRYAVGRVLCYVTDHAWQKLGVNIRKHQTLSHLHPHAGKLRVCRRCGLVWDDFLWHGVGSLTGTADQLSEHRIVRQRLEMWSRRHRVRLR